MSINHRGGPKIGHVVKEETKEKIKNKSLGKHYSKITEWKNGHIPWNKNLKYKETKYNYLCDIAIKNGIKTTIKLAKSKISKAELLLKKQLEKNNIEFIHQYPYPLGVADFYLPKQNLIIECYGSYWHSKPDYIKRDKRKNNWLQKNNYNVLILCSEDINKNSKINDFFDITKFKEVK
jgi:very-short-patch-repair endonuclease